MTKRIQIMLMAVLLPLAGVAQNITVQSAVGQNITTFVEQQLKGNGVYITNVKFNNVQGNITHPQIGTFNSNGYQLLQMDEGVIMTTGNVSVAPGPNTNDITGSGASSPVTPHYTDNMTQMAALVSNPLTSCATLDFDFVSISPYVTLNYCFGSEEYPEYVWSTFNDVFAFFVTGPNPNNPQSTMTKNIAIIPHTVSTTNPNGIAVAINTVNGKTEAENPSSNWYHYSDFYVANNIIEDPSLGSSIQGVQYDGFTQKLSANVTLIPCVQYHMHISICNVEDNGYDSGVFLEKNSFNSPSAEVSLSHRYADTIERSVPVVLPLTLAGSVYNSGTVTVIFGGSAMLGRDYTVTTETGQELDNGLHSSFNVTQGEHSLTFRGTPTADLSEPKLIELYLRTSLCENYPSLKTNDTIRYILIEDDIVLLRDTTIVAYDTCKQVGVELAIGNHPPYTFHWGPETDIDFPNQQHSTATITESRNYRVTVTDAVGHSDDADVTVEVRPRTNGIDDADLPTRDAEVSVYPNPTDGEINLEFDGIIQVDVFNAAGICVFTRRCNNDCRTLNISPLPTGLYTVRITTNLGIKTERVVVR